MVSDLESKVFILEEHLDKTHEIRLDEFTHLRAYHACRPLEISDYLKSGIKPINYDLALKDVKERIISAQITEEKVVLILNDEWADFEDIHKRVWLQMNKECLLTRAGHYLIYGSEFTNTVAMRLGCRDKLKKVGIPTIFYCNIPLEDISCGTVQDIEQCCNRGDIDDIAFSVKAVAPKHIVGYEHPKKAIPDPFNWGRNYEPDYSV